MGRRLAAGVRDGRHAEVAGAAHYPNLERPELWDAAVQAFLEEVLVPPR
ncbi:hypothetical protein [Intrasporangium sp. YIM S08009]|nr:hypothetical protein [Intrasporangium sp. YIM S08009]